MIILKIVFTKDKKRLPPKTLGLYEGTARAKKITILKSQDHRDTLIHELCHFILDITGKAGYIHGKKHTKLHKFLKEFLLK